MKYDFEKKKREKTGFTLVELMVSVAIFSIVLVFSLGTILTIVDANRKARTLSSVMNNVNFALENMTRSIKTGRDIRTSVATGGCTDGGQTRAEESIELHAIDLSAPVSDFQRVRTIYRLCVKDNRGAIEKLTQGTNSFEPITSPEVDIDVLEFTLFDKNGQRGGQVVRDGYQPRVLVTISGNVEFARNVRSEFNIQTTVSARDLNF